MRPNLRPVKIGGCDYIFHEWVSTKTTYKATEYQQSVGILKFEEVIIQALVEDLKTGSVKLFDMNNIAFVDEVSKAVCGS